MKVDSGDYENGTWARPTRAGEGLSNLARKGAWECRNSPPPFLGVLGCAIMTDRLRNRASTRLKASS